MARKVQKGKDKLELHWSKECQCSVLTNPNNCIYQFFLDGWSFTPEVGYGQKRGEIFTPRFIVDKMIVQSGILRDRAVYDYDYTGSPEVLRRYIGNRVFEPAVGTGNFVTTILWHKLEHANYLTSTHGNPEGKKTVTQLRRYQAYTLVALASVYFNDIDAGNLQTTKWRILRDGEINSDANIAYWVNHVTEFLHQEVDSETVRSGVEKSIKAAGENWGTADEDRGILDVLYKKHTGQEPPAWLKTAWRTVLDENGKLFNGVVEEDTVDGDTIIPGYRNIVWNFWWFNYDKDYIYVAKRRVPLIRQILESRKRELEAEISEIKSEGSVAGLGEGMLPLAEFGDYYSFANEEVEKEHRRVQRELSKVKMELRRIEQYGKVEISEIAKG